jgi:NAD+ synthase
MKILKAEINPEQVTSEIENFIISQVTKAKAEGGVVGLSGGIDSTTVAWLAQSAFNKYNVENPDKTILKLYGLILPADSESLNDVKDAVTTAEDLGIEYKIVDINSILEERKKRNPDIFENKYHYGNAASRERMIHLYGEAASKNLLVLGTGNKDEDS